MKIFIFFFYVSKAALANDLIAPKYLHKRISVQASEFTLLPLLTLTGISSRLVCCAMFQLRNASADNSNSFHYDPISQICEIGTVSPSVSEVTPGYELIVPST